MKDFHNTALVVEDDHAQRSLVSMLLEESDIKVIQCESAEAAVLVLNKIGGCLSILFTDVNLAGSDERRRACGYCKEKISKAQSHRDFRQPITASAAKHVIFAEALESIGNYTKVQEIGGPRPWARSMAAMPDSGTFRTYRGERK